MVQGDHWMKTRARDPNSGHAGINSEHQAKTLMIMSKMQDQLKVCNSNMIFREMNETLKHRFNSKQDEHSKIQDSRESEANPNESKQCSNSLTPTNTPRLKPSFMNFFKKETKTVLRRSEIMSMNVVNFQCLYSGVVFALRFNVTPKQFGIIRGCYGIDVCTACFP